MIIMRRVRLKRSLESDGIDRAKGRAIRGG